nr:MAG TPA: hypothetical protein [Caudoviricetes sp.]
MAYVPAARYHNLKPVKAALLSLAASVSTREDAAFFYATHKSITVATAHNPIARAVPPADALLCCVEKLTGGGSRLLRVNR